MSDQTKADGHGSPAAGLAPCTFKPCGARPTTQAARIDATELPAIADMIDPVYRQTVVLFCWATGASTQADVTAEAVERFCDVMGQVDGRFGSHPGHVDMTVGDAIALAKHGEVRPRSPQTMARHRNRLKRIAEYRLPRLETRLRPPGWVKLDADEVASIKDREKHRGYLFVERFGTIRLGIPLAAFDLMMRPSSSAKMLAPVLIQEAAELAASLQQQGRAFVATLHEDSILLIEGFWCARATE